MSTNFCEEVTFKRGKKNNIKLELKIHHQSLHPLFSFAAIFCPLPPIDIGPSLPYWQYSSICQLGIAQLLDPLFVKCEHFTISKFRTVWKLHLRHGINVIFLLEGIVNFTVFSSYLGQQQGSPWTSTRCCLPHFLSHCTSHRGSPDYQRPRLSAKSDFSELQDNIQTTGHTHIHRKTSLNHRFPFTDILRASLSYFQTGGHVVIPLVMSKNLTGQHLFLVMRNILLTKIIEKVPEKLLQRSGQIDMN